ncbi:MAG TPA: DNA translocase FtsK 4TM domain-containing protein [Cytophagales bacterium]|nr:DNA translocase FtsK 4TM domain-containing protein [Cytophagales bacterium]
MAKNTYKTNTYKEEKKDFKKESKKSSKPKFKLSFSFFKDKKFKLSVGFLLIFASFFLTVAFISYLFTGKNDQSVIESLWSTDIRESGGEIQNWLGIIGAYVSYYLIFKWFGIAAFLITPIVFLLGVRLVFGKEIYPIFKFIKFAAFYIFWLGLLLGYIILITEEENYLGLLSGGIGYEMAVLFSGMIGWGTPLFLIFTLIIFLIYFFNVTTINKTPSAKPAPVIVNEVEESVYPFIEEEKEVPAEKEEADNGVEEWKVSVKPEKKTLTKNPSLDLDLDIVLPTPTEETVPFIRDDSPYVVVKDEIVPLNALDTPTNGKIENYDPTLDLSSYRYPTPELLNDYADKKGQVTREELEANKDKIVKTLNDYGITITSIKATIGPTVTLYEIIPDAGIRISKIKNLEDDIALSLAALGIRIIAPIPGKGTIGIEVPNVNRETVSAKSVFSTEKFLKSDKELPIALGKTISNEVFVADLAKMPHLLMAGATGQGKSVGINILLTSLLYKKHPSQLKFVLVDPKQVELSIFNKIERHFLAKLPNSEEAIITDTKKVIHTLNSLCIEMENRYSMLKEAQCRNLSEYNKKFIERKLSPTNGHMYLPYIVLVIDEFADLMMTAGKEIEAPIARLAQKARAIGIHLVLATQRPSVNVITGIIKANFPARLSFKVTQKNDSRTILDAGGAEQLVGMGDMLLSTGSDLIRIQCAFIDTPEVEQVVDYIGSQRGYSSAFHLPEFEGDEPEEKEAIDLANRDPLFEEAARLIVTHQQGSTSLIQRRMKLGYNRAGRLIDQLEAAGVVGAFEGSKAREVLITDEYALEQLLNSLANKK